MDSKPVENPTQKKGRFAKKGNGEREKFWKEDLRIFYENLISNLCLGCGCETGFKNCQKTTWVGLCVPFHHQFWYINCATKHLLLLEFKIVFVF
jgi:hypothetical protein